MKKHEARIAAAPPAIAPKMSGSRLDGADEDFSSDCVVGDGDGAGKRGTALGITLGIEDVTCVGFVVGDVVGEGDGAGLEGLVVGGSEDGSCVGATVGDWVGPSVGGAVGATVGGSDENQSCTFTLRTVAKSALRRKRTRNAMEPPLLWSKP